MKLPLATSEALPPNVERARNIVAVAILLGLLLAAASIGSHKSERAHRALDLQYQQCVDRYGYGGEAFRECLRGER
jgi:hypothetical protein